MVALIVTPKLTLIATPIVTLTPKVTLIITLPYYSKWSKPSPGTPDLEGGDGSPLGVCHGALQDHSGGMPGFRVGFWGVGCSHLRTCPPFFTTVVTSKDPLKDP